MKRIVSWGWLWALASCQDVSGVGSPETKGSCDFDWDCPVVGERCVAGTCGPPRPESLGRADAMATPPSDAAVALDALPRGDAAQLPDQAVAGDAAQLVDQAVAGDAEQRPDQAVAGDAAPPPRRPIRPVLMTCGYEVERAHALVRGRLVGAIQEVRRGCSPTVDCQALLTNDTRAGVGIEAYVRQGGQLIVAFADGPAAYGVVFGLPPDPRHETTGFEDSGHVMPVLQYSPGDPFWRANVFEATHPDLAPWSWDVSHLPGLVPLGGGTPDTVSLAYRDHGEGRVWFATTAWMGSMRRFDDTDRDLLASMILGGEPVHE